jgi:hypothetical protein
MDAEKELVELLRARGSNVPAIQAAAERSGELLPALTALLEEPEGARVDAVKGALDYLPSQDWRPLVTLALDAFAADLSHKVARVVIDSGIFQAPYAFHPHLKRIFFMEPFLKVFGPSVWRGSGRRSLDFLQEVLDGPDETLRKRAVEVLQQTHDPEVIAFALAEEQRLGGPFGWLYALNRYAYYSFEVVDGEVQLLYPPRAYHLHFPEEYVREQNQSPPLHPTWVNRELDPQPVAFGGVLDDLCPQCGRRLQHLVTLEPLPDGLKVSGLPRLVLGVCTNGNCLGLGIGAELYYDHDAQGRPHGLSDSEEEQGWEIPFLAPTTARLGSTPERWLWQDSNSRWANLNRVGGLPSWVQEEGHPMCPRCGHAMPFLMQLDSGLQAVDEGYVRWCSGLLYAFWCDRCKVSAFFRHCC